MGSKAIAMVWALVAVILPAALVCYERAPALGAALRALRDVVGALLVNLLV